MSEIQVRNLTKTDWLIVALSMFLAFFINGSYRFYFRFDFEILAQTMTTALVSTLLGYVFLILFYRKSTKNLLWPYLIVMLCAGFLAGTEAYVFIRQTGARFEDSGKAMGITMTAFMFISCFAYGIVFSVTKMLKNLFITRKEAN